MLISILYVKPSRYLLCSFFLSAIFLSLQFCIMSQRCGSWRNVWWRKLLVWFWEFTWVKIEKYASEFFIPFANNFSLFFLSCYKSLICCLMIFLTNENDNFNYLLRSMNKYRRSQLSQKLNPSFGKCSIGCVWGCLERLEDRWKMSNMWWNKCWSW